MASGIRIALGLGFVVATAGTAQAECLSAACNNKITIFILMVIGFGLMAIALLVMLIRAKWRKAGLRLLVLLVAIFAGIPFATQGWLRLKQFAMERREILGQPPVMAGRTPLVIVPEWGCYAGPCESVLRGRGAAGSYIVMRSSLDRFDPEKPILLADLPLMFQTYNARKTDRQARVLTAEERRDAATRIDYVILSGPILSDFAGYGSKASKVDRTGAVDHLLRANPALANQTARELVTFAMAPIDPGSGIISFADLRFDVLELWFHGNALAYPLAPKHWYSLPNTKVTADLAAKALCPLVDGERDWFCVSGLH